MITEQQEALKAGTAISGGNDLRENVDAFFFEKLIRETKKMSHADCLPVYQLPCEVITFTKITQNKRSFRTKCQHVQ